MGSENTTLFLGASTYDGKPIAVQAMSVGRASDNEKTGDMIQHMITSTEKPPVDKDAAVSACGGCPFLEKGICYVNKAWLRKAWNRIQDTILDLSEFRRLRRVKRQPHRIGSEGDPCAVPLAFWRDFFKTVRPKGWTSYVHGWKSRKMHTTGEMATACDPGFAAFSMASCDTVEERKEAKALGYRTARVAIEGEALLDGEIICPAIKTDGRIQCADCLLCDGDAMGRASFSPYFKGKNRPDIVFPVHGGAGQQAKFANLVEAVG